MIHLQQLKVIRVIIITKSRRGFIRKKKSKQVTSPIHHPIDPMAQETTLPNQQIAPVLSKLEITFAEP